MFGWEGCVRRAVAVEDRMAWGEIGQPRCRSREIVRDQIDTCIYAC